MLPFSLNGYELFFLVDSQPNGNPVMGDTEAIHANYSDVRVHMG